MCLGDLLKIVKFGQYVQIFESSSDGDSVYCIFSFEWTGVRSFISDIFLCSEIVCVDSSDEPNSLNIYLCND